MAGTHKELPLASRQISAFPLLFLTIAILEMIAIALSNVQPFMELLTKPLIMLSLGVYYLYQTRRQSSRVHTFMIWAILFSLCGDILLWMKGETYFLLGLSSFLLAHICYIGAFSIKSGHSNSNSQTLISRKPWLILLFVGYLILLLWGIYPALEQMLVPVIVYALTITIMAVTALNRWQMVSEHSFGWVFMGALLFVLSDSLIALGRFGGHLISIPLLQYWIMGTYMCAQFFIVKGMLKMNNKSIIQKPRPI